MSMETIFMVLKKQNQFVSNIENNHILIKLNLLYLNQFIIQKHFHTIKNQASVDSRAKHKNMLLQFFSS